jgi:hypothetical protein
MKYRRKRDSSDAGVQSNINTLYLQVEVEVPSFCPSTRGHIEQPYNFNGIRNLDRPCTLKVVGLGE